MMQGRDGGRTVEYLFSLRQHCADESAEGQDNGHAARGGFRQVRQARGSLVGHRPPERHDPARQDESDQRQDRRGTRQAEGRLLRWMGGWSTASQM